MRPRRLRVAASWLPGGPGTDVHPPGVDLWRQCSKIHRVSYLWVSLLAPLHRRRIGDLASRESPMSSNARGHPRGVACGSTDQGSASAAKCVVAFIEISSAAVGATWPTGTQLPRCRVTAAEPAGAERCNAPTAAANRCNRAQTVGLRKTLGSHKIRNLRQDSNQQKTEHHRPQASCTAFEPRRRPLNYGISWSMKSVPALPV